jgi:hypothetical protein
MSTTTARKATRRPRLSDEEREARVTELKATLDTAVDRLLNDPEQWVTFLETVANFAGQYSFGNQLLILAQAQHRGFEPTMTLPAGDLAALRAGRKPTFGWAKLGRYPRTGEKGLRIWRPAMKRYTEAEYQELTRKPKRDAQGRPPTRLIGFNIEHVFDVSQTDGEPVDPPAPVTIRRQVRAQGVAAPVLLTGQDTTGSLAEVIALIEKRGYTYSRRSRAEFAEGGMAGANGVTFHAHTHVWVRDDIEDAQALKTTIHELAHIDCGHIDPEVRAEIHRGQRETEAESVAYIVAGALGMDTGQYSAPYVAGWATNAETLTKAANTILRVAKEILGALIPDEAEED